MLLLLAWLEGALSTMTSCAPVAAGDVLLDGLRVNQLKLSRNLTGSLQVSEKEVHMHAKVRHACCHRKCCLHAPAFCLSGLAFCSPREMHYCYTQ